MIEQNFIELNQATLDIKKCLNDNDFLCQKLNDCEPRYLRDLYRNVKSGVIIDIRKEVAKEILLNTLTVDKMMEIIQKHKDANPQPLKMWSNPYRILHPIVNHQYGHLDSSIKDFCETLRLRIGDVKYTISNFYGSMHQGSDEYWIAFYNSHHQDQSEGLQLFLKFEDGFTEYGVYEHHSKQYKVGPFEFSTLESFNNFIDENKSMILNDPKKEYMTFVDAAGYILELNENKPMTSNEIWEQISKYRLVKTNGKTPAASLSTKILSNCLDSTIKNNHSNKEIFLIVGSNPMKFQLRYYMPKHIRETILRGGFVTMEQLKSILDEQKREFEKILLSNNLSI
jgi:hypothetical protein